MGLRDNYFLSINELFILSPIYISLLLSNVKGYKYVIIPGQI